MQNIWSGDIPDRNDDTFTVTAYALWCKDRLLNQMCSYQQLHQLMMFSEFFYYMTQLWICNKVGIRDPITP